MNRPDTLAGQLRYAEPLTVTGGLDGYRIGFQDGNDFVEIATFKSLNLAWVEAQRLTKEGQFVADQWMRSLER